MSEDPAPPPDGDEFARDADPDADPDLVADVPDAEFGEPGGDELETAPEDEGGDDSELPEEEGEEDDESALPA